MIERDPIKILISANNLERKGRQFSPNKSRIKAIQEHLSKKYGLESEYFEEDNFAIGFTVKARKDRPNRTSEVIKKFGIRVWFNKALNLNHHDILFLQEISEGSFDLDCRNILGYTESELKNILEQTIDEIFRDSPVRETEYSELTRLFYKNSQDEKSKIQIIVRLTKLAERGIKRPEIIKFLENCREKQDFARVATDMLNLLGINSPV